HPSPPHCCFFRNDRRSLAHADLQRGVTGRELRPQERIDEVDDSEREDDARTENHENFCCQDALPILTQGFNYCTALRAGELRFEELGEGLSSPPPRRSISCTSSPSRFPRARSALMSPNTLHFFLRAQIPEITKVSAAGEVLAWHGRCLGCGGRIDPWDQCATIKVVPNLSRNA